MRIFKTKLFARFARREAISNATLADGIARAARGSIDADLGGGLIKQRVARAGKGRSGGYRTLIAFRVQNLAVFMFGFPKSDRDNIDDDELEDWRAAASSWLEAGDELLALAAQDGLLIEVRNDD